MDKILFRYENSYASYVVLSDLRHLLPVDTLVVDPPHTGTGTNWHTFDLLRRPLSRIVSARLPPLAQKFPEAVDLK